MTVAVVTGGGSGIGAAISTHLARDGYHVVVADCEGAAAERVAQQIMISGGDATPVTADVSVTDAADELFVRAATLGRLSVLVNNAGVTTIGTSLHEISDDDWDAAFNACLRPVVTCGRAGLRAMLAGDGGSIVNIASINQRTAIPGLAAYTAAKGAIVALSRQLAVEYGPRGVRCNVVSPGWVRTPATERRLRGPTEEDVLRQATPTPQLGESDDVAAAVAFLASPAAHHINGAELVIDGAASIVAGSHLLRSAAASSATSTSKPEE
jgi:NAD(P)-dependent dehydrogenase (short-subunit alcohol dehydrogenase family)